MRVEAAPRGRESIREKGHILGIETESGVLRGEILSQPGTEMIRIRITYPVEHSGMIMEIDRSSVREHEPVTYYVDGVERKSRPLKHVGEWMAGSPLWLADLIAQSSYDESKYQQLPVNEYSIGVTAENRAERMAQYKQQRAPEEFRSEDPALAGAYVGGFDGIAGWKAHLNVRPEDVNRVAEYLRANGFHYKYLSGGELEDGKIFTIYCGDAARLKHSAQTIVQSEIGECLAMPMAPGEVEIEPGVVARFDAGPQLGFTRYGEFGIQFVSTGGVGTKVLQSRVYEEMIHAAEVAYTNLKERYGSYFTG